MVNQLWKAWYGLPHAAKLYVVPGYVLFCLGYGWLLSHLQLYWALAGFLYLGGCAIATFVLAGFVGWLFIREFAAYRSKMGRYGEKKQ